MSGHTIDAWRTIAQGGRWTVAEVQKANPKSDPKMIQNAVRNMVESGMVVRYEGAKYGVTSNCTIPRGMTIAEVVKVVA